MFKKLLSKFFDSDKAKETEAPPITSSPSNPPRSIASKKLSPRTVSLPPKKTASAPEPEESTASLSNLTQPTEAQAPGAELSSPAPEISASLPPQTEPVEEIESVLDQKIDPSTFTAKQAAISEAKELCGIQADMTTFQIQAVLKRLHKRYRWALDYGQDELKDQAKTKLDAMVLIKESL